MQYYEMSTLTAEVGALMPAGEKLTRIMAAVQAFFDEAEAGAFLGAWTSELSRQNRLVFLRVFDDRASMEEERRRIYMSANPFGCGEALTRIEVESYAQFPDLPPLTAGGHGPIYEFRHYELKVGGLAPTLAAWAKAVPGRSAVSPLLTAMYALDGAPRFTHIWPYESHERRTALRAEAFGSGAWPPKGAPEWLAAPMWSEIYAPVAGSRLV